jgi:hypothetical protein
MGAVFTRDGTPVDLTAGDHFTNEDHAKAAAIVEHRNKMRRGSQEFRTGSLSLAEFHTRVAEHRLTDSQSYAVRHEYLELESQRLSAGVPESYGGSPGVERDEAMANAAAFIASNYARRGTCGKCGRDDRATDPQWCCESTRPYPWLKDASVTRVRDWLRRETEASCGSAFVIDFDSLQAFLKNQGEESA